MRFDILDLKEFYAGKIGQLALELLSERLAESWPSLTDQRICTIGYCLPYIESNWPGDNAMAFMPATMGVVPWPEGRENKTALVNEVHLPLADNSVDYVLIIHALEMTYDPETMMHELWRVLVPGGRVLIVVPSRSGIWARRDITPWGSGRPFSRHQLRHLLHDAGFSPLTWTACLAAPPIRWTPMARIAKVIERPMRRVLPQLCGLNIVEAQKLVYAPVNRARTRSFVLKPVSRPALIPRMDKF